MRARGELTNRPDTTLDGWVCGNVSGVLVPR